MANMLSVLMLDVKDKKIQNFDYRLLKVRQNQIEPDPEIEKLIEEAYEPYKKQVERSCWADQSHAAPAGLFSEQHGKFAD